LEMDFTAAYSKCQNPKFIKSVLKGSDDGIYT
jgi:hypothetical protein